MMDEALALLRRLNALTDERGERHADKISYHGYQPWWMHQQLVFDEYIVPYVRGRQIPTPRRPLPRLRHAASELHYRSSSSVALAFALANRPDVLVYTVDSVDPTGANRWIPGLFTALARRHQRVSEFVWSVSGAKALENERRRRRAVVYWQGIQPFKVRSPVWPQVLFRENDDVFLDELVTRVMLPLCVASTRMIPRIEKLLRVMKPQGVYLMDDTLHAFEVVAACKRLGIPTVGLQHGQLMRFTVGLMAYGYDNRVDLGFDRFCVWGDLFRDVLTRNSRMIRADSVVVSGRARGPSGSHSVRLPAQRPGPRLLFLMEMYDPDVQGEVRAYIHALVSEGVAVVIKPHPAAVDHAHVPGARITRDSLDDALDKADVVAGSYSSGLFEAMRRAKPVVVFRTSLWHDPNDLGPLGLADVALTPADIVGAMHRALSVDSDELARRRIAVWGTANRDAGEVAVKEMSALRRATDV